MGQGVAIKSQGERNPDQWLIVALIKYLVVGLLVAQVVPPPPATTSMID